MIKEHQLGDIEKQSILFLNIRSLRNHHDQLCCLIEKFKTKPIAIGLGETWLTDYDPIDSFKIDGYLPLITENRETKKGGGLVFLYAMILQANSSPLKKRKKLENYSIKLTNTQNNFELIFHIMYRPPSTKNSNFLVLFDELLEQLEVGNKNMILCGDFNKNISGNNNQLKNYKNLLENLGLQVNNLEPTRVTATTSTCVDHMISNSQYENKTIESNISDHFPILTLLDEKGCPSVMDAQNKKITTWVRNQSFLKNNFVLIRYLFFLNHMLQKIEFHWSIDKKLQTITENFHVALDRFAPYKKINFSKKSWINKECRKQRQKKNQLFKQWINPSTENRDKYKTQRNVCDKTIRNAKSAFNDQKTTNIENLRKIFSILRNLWSKTRQDTYCKLTADDFNDFFSIIGEKLANNFGENLQIKSNRFEKTFVFNPVTINETSTAIKNLKNSKSVGHDGISNITLKQALSVKSQPLTEVFNQGYFEEHYPEALKVARVIPIHKNGSVHDPGNY